MATLSTLGQMMLQLAPKIDQYDPLEVAKQQNFVQGGRLDNQTALLKLEDLRRQQQTAADVRQAYQQHPELLGFGGGAGPQSLLGSPDLSMGGGGPMTQQTFGPGGTGPVQTVPGGMDLSRFATGGALAGPQPTLATLGPQPRQDPLEAIVRQNPDAARQIMSERFQIQERQLKMRSTVASSVAQLFQGVTDQASWEQAKGDLQSFAPQLAARLPQVYSKEVRDRLVAQSQSAKDNAETTLAEARAAEAQQKAKTEQWKRETFLPKILEEPSTAPGGGDMGTTTATGTAAGIDTSRLTPSFVEKTGAVERRLGMQQGDLARLMHFETGGTFDPSVRNRAGSGATGLIQFMPETAKALGTTTEALAKMSPEQQLEYVEKYLSQYKGKIGNLQDAYMAVLYPKAIGQSGNYKLFTREGEPTAYRQNAGLDTEGKGYVTVADAVAAVQRTTGSMERSRPGTATATAGRPATTPEVSRLNQRIAELTQRRDRYAAGSAIDPGLNTYADNLTKQIDELRQERNRLEELPRKVQEQEALLPGQKAVARAGEETKAEMERAPKEEIDAINRGLPSDQRIPYGTTREEIRKKGLVGGIPIPEKGNEELIARSTIVNQLGQLKTTFGDLPTGPLQTRLNDYRELLGVDLTDEAVAYRTLLNTVRNRVVNALSGAAVSPDEAKRILAELPDEKTSKQAFKGRLETALKIAEDVYKRRAQYYRRSGHSVPESLMSPYWDEPLPGATGSGAAAKKPSSNVDKFKAIQP